MVGAIVADENFRNIQIENIFTVFDNGNSCVGMRFDNVDFHEVFFWMAVFLDCLGFYLLDDVCVDGAGD